VNLGANEVIGYTVIGFNEAVRNVDVVIDLIGDAKPGDGARSLSVLRRGGPIVHVASELWPTFASDAARAGANDATYKVAPDTRRLARITEMIDAGDYEFRLKIYSRRRK
jgi:hypothetical protein